MRSLLLAVAWPVATAVPSVTLSNGVEMPMVAAGSWQHLEAFHRARSTVQVVFWERGPCLAADATTI